MTTLLCCSQSDYPSVWQCAIFPIWSMITLSVFLFFFLISKTLMMLIIAGGQSAFCLPWSGMDRARQNNRSFSIVSGFFSILNYFHCLLCLSVSFGLFSFVCSSSSVDVLYQIVKFAHRSLNHLTTPDNHLGVCLVNECRVPLIRFHFKS